MTEPLDWTPQEITNPCPDCGKETDSFACRARHVAINIENLKQDRN